jgi:hypothetical protein
MIESYGLVSGWTGDKVCAVMAVSLRTEMRGNKTEER